MTIDNQVLIGLIKNWQDQEEYYSGKRPKNIPVSEVMEIIKGCPPIGEDAVFIKGKRFEYAFNLGKKEVINELHVLLNKMEKSNDE